MSVEDERSQLVIPALQQRMMDEMSRIFGWQYLVKYCGQSEGWMPNTLRGMARVANKSVNDEWERDATDEERTVLARALQGIVEEGIDHSDAIEAVVKAGFRLPPNLSR